MRFILALVVPPLAVLLCGRPIAALFNILLCLCGGIPGILHAMYVVAEYKADQRMETVIRSVNLR